MTKKNQKINSVAGRYINPFTDFGFKKIFGEEPNKDLLIDFLNELLRDQGVHIQTLSYKKTAHLGATDLDRKVIFDLYCENQQGEKFIVEMQKAKQSFFKDRTLFYSTFPIQEQAIKGEWDYRLKAVFAVAILDFTFKDMDKEKTVVNKIQLLDIKSHELFYDKLAYVFVQMPNFTKDIDELDTHLDKWFYVLKHMDKLDRIPEKIKDKIFEKVFKIAEYSKLNPDERVAYEDSLKYYRDLKNSLDKAFEDGQAALIPLLKQAEERVEQERKEKEQERKDRVDAEIKAQIANKKLNHIVLKQFNKGKTIQEIAEDLEILVEEVAEIIASNQSK